MISAASGETPGHNVRVPTCRWLAASDTARSLGTNREAMINKMLQWGIEHPVELAGLLGLDRAASPE